MGAAGKRHGPLLERVVDAGAVVGGRGLPLPDELDLHGLDWARHARRAGVLAVLGPAHPADAGGVDAVPDVVVVRDGAREPEANRLDRAGLPRGAALGGRRGVPALPADTRDVGVHLDRGAVRVVRAGEGHPQGLEGERAPGGAGGGAVFDGGLPPEAGDVGAAGDMRIAVGNRGSIFIPVINIAIPIDAWYGGETRILPAIKLGRILRAQAQRSVVALPVPVLSGPDAPTAIAKARIGQDVFEPAGARVDTRSVASSRDRTAKCFCNRRMIGVLDAVIFKVKIYRQRRVMAL